MVLPKDLKGLGGRKDTYMERIMVLFQERKRGEQVAVVDGDKLRICAGGLHTVRPGTRGDCLRTAKMRSSIKRKETLKKEGKKKREGAGKA